MITDVENSNGVREGYVHHFTTAQLEELAASEGVERNIFITIANKLPGQKYAEATAFVDKLYNSRYMNFDTFMACHDLISSQELFNNETVDA